MLLMNDLFISLESIRFRLTAHYVLLRTYFGLSRQDLERQLGQYIRERFNVNGSTRVIVDLKNYDIDIGLHIYEDMILISSKMYPGMLH